MGYVDISLYFFCIRETVADLVNLSWAIAANTAPHHLLSFADTPPNTDDNAHTKMIFSDLDETITAHLPQRIPVIVLRYIDVYFDNYIVLAQGGRAQQCRFRDHVFHSIDRIF